MGQVLCSAAANKRRSATATETETSADSASDLSHSESFSGFDFQRFDSKNLPSTVSYQAIEQAVEELESFLLKQPAQKLPQRWTDYLHNIVDNLKQAKLHHGEEETHRRMNSSVSQFEKIKEKKFVGCKAEVNEWILDLVQVNQANQAATEDNSTVQTTGERQSKPAEIYINLSDPIKEKLTQMQEWNFNVFDLFDLCKADTLVCVGFHLCHEYQLIEHFGIDPVKLASFLRALSEAYIQENPYHNAMHAVDVVAACHSMFQSLLSQAASSGDGIKNRVWDFKRGSSAFMSSSDSETPPKRRRRVSTLRCGERLVEFQKEELFAFFIGALLHDVGHPGNNNDFEVNSRSELALMYNDKHVLENYHLYRAFTIAKQPANDFIHGSKLHWGRLRKLIRELVIHTDMSLHTQVMDYIAKLPLNEEESGNLEPEWTEESRQRLLISALHACDISNAAKNRELMLEWSDRVYEEFYSQHDLEVRLGLPTQQMFDRRNPNHTKEMSSVGFISYIVRPIFQGLEPYFPVCSLAMEQLATNKDYWKSLIPHGSDRRSSSHLT